MSFKDLKKERVEGELGETLLKLYPTRTNGYAKIGEKKWFLPYKYVENGSKLYNFETRPDDIWVITFSRSGTTLTQELTWLVANDMNFEEAHRRSLTDRFPFIDLNAMYSNEDLACTSNMHNEMFSVEFVQNQLSPRFIKTHMPFDLLPTVINSDCKIVYVARNPRDVVISWYHFQKNMKLYNYQGTFEQFCDLFLNDHTLWSPYWEHIKEAWAMRHRPNLLFLFYEDFVKDLSGIIKKVATFFGKTYSDEEIDKLVEHLKIDNFRRNPMVNQPSNSSTVKPDAFIRQGKIGGWKEMFTAEIEEKFSKWVADNMKDTNLTFPV